MSEWGWVLLGFSVLYGMVAAYIGWTAWRIRDARRRLLELQ